MPYYTGQAGSSDSPYRPGTADSSWEQPRPSTMEHARPDLFAHMPPVSTSSSQHRPEPVQASQHQSVSDSAQNLYLGANVITPRQTSFPRDQIDAGVQFSTVGATDGFGHNVQALMPADTPRAAHFGNSSNSNAGAMVGAQHSFAPVASAAWPSTLPQQPDSMGYSRYAYPSQTSSGSWASQTGTSMSQSVIYESSSSTNASPNRSQTYYDLSSDHFDHSGYASHMNTHSYPMYGASTSKLGGTNAYMSAPQPDYQPEEIDSMLNQVSSLYKTANTKKMAEFYRDKWARMWLTCNYTLKPSIQISIPRTILHESYRRACDSFGLEPLQAASFGKVLRSQFPDVAQRRLGGRGKTRFHYCGFGTSNDREAVKVKLLLEDEKAGRLQLSAGLSAEYAAEARGKARSEGHEAEASSSSFRTHSSSDASQYDNSPHASSESSGLGHSGMAADDRLIASAFATLNSAVLTPPGTSSGADYGGQDAARYAQVPSQGQSSHAGQLYGGGAGGAGMPRRHTVSHSYSGLSDLSFLPAGLHSSGMNDAGVAHPSSEVSAFGASTASGISEPAQSASLLNSPASSLHGYQYLQDPRHVPSSMPFRRSEHDLQDWPALPDHQHSSGSTTGGPGATASGGAAGFLTGGSGGAAASHESTRKAWPNHFSLE
ncbi:hypothetical protein PHSY_002871 [Pseudozyma hubeiensis SY62]|uniref:RFX-type winged-helix domain-containing protein n=1 Tax=Pseudozyma hubeiensis (strain SY62) TaxID=1305764 RepID=R9P1Z3_PSEHS|nr:hypothetical protein PHSY_002871 [Pseudozyma hubeiensis SY62]GAC95296.1 hypothetical protein PHSY_002871 [Pseudozyma hubeiensis SY62]